MLCPKCKSENVKIDTLMSVKEKRKKGALYWIFIGWWFEPIMWIIFTIPKLLLLIFGKHTKTVSQAETWGTCQNCGHRWKI